MLVDDSDKQFRRHTFDTVSVTIVLVVDVGDDVLVFMKDEADIHSLLSKTVSSGSDFEVDDLVKCIDNPVAIPTVINAKTIPSISHFLFKRFWKRTSILYQVFPLLSKRGII